MSCQYTLQARLDARYDSDGKDDDDDDDGGDNDDDDNH